MTRATRITIGTLFAMVAILIALVLSIVSPAFDSTVYSANYTTQANVNLPGLTEDRYAPESKATIITIITDQVIPAFLPNTSGQGVCGVDITCNDSGKATN